MRNALAYANKGQRQVVLALINTAFAQETTETAREQWRVVADHFRTKLPKLAKFLDEAEHDVVAFTGFPRADRKQIASTNPLERLNAEIKRRTDVVGIFPNDAAIVRLVGALCWSKTTSGNCSDDTSPSKDSERSATTKTNASPPSSPAEIQPASRVTRTPLRGTRSTFNFHRSFLLRFIEHVDLNNVTLDVHDWGGTLGLTLPVNSDFRARLERLIAMSTVLPTGEPLGPHYDEWRSLVRKMSPDVPVGQLIRNITPPLMDAEMAAYDAPFPDSRYKAGVRMFPELAMVEPDSEGVSEATAALQFWSHEWSGRSFMAIGAKEADVAPMHGL